MHFGRHGAHVSVRPKQTKLPHLLLHKILFLTYKNQKLNHFIILKYKSLSRIMKLLVKNIISER